jgi:hypothetical protein
MVTKLFISYATEDVVKMKSLKKIIENKFKNNCEVINIVERRDPTMPLSEKIINGLNESRFFIPILTKNSIKNQWVNQEIGYAKAIESTDKDKIKFFPIVENSILNILKGFIHKQLDLPFKYTSNKKFPQKESASYKKCREQLCQHLCILMPQEDITYQQSKSVDAETLKTLMDKIYKTYNLHFTELLHPKIKDGFIKTHSHSPNGYFDYLMRESCQKYSFNFFDNPKIKNRGLIIHVDNTRPLFNLELYLSPRENIEIKSEMDRVFDSSEVKIKEFDSNFLQQKVDEKSLLDYANKKYKYFKHNDHKINKLLWRDLDKNKYKTLEDIDHVVRKAKPAVDAYYKNNSSLFNSGTDFLTKSLGFVDDNFRNKHPFGIETINAFKTYSRLINKL